MLPNLHWAAPPHPNTAVAAQGPQARAEHFGACPTPQTSGLQTQLCPQLAGMITESHPRTALRANSTRLPQTQPSTQKIISSLALLRCGREQRDSRAPAATPEALCAPGAKGPRGEGTGAPSPAPPRTGQHNPESWQEEELLNKEKSQHFFLFLSFVMPDPSGDRPTGLAGAPVGLWGLECTRCTLLLGCF